MRKFIYLSLISVVFSISIFAQETTISGSVKNEQTGDAVVGVNITIKDLYVGTITDLNGNFSFKTKIAPPYQLVFSCVGFETKEFTMNNPDEIVDITLKEGTLLGEEVVITAGRIEEKIMLSSVSLEKMGIKDIQLNAAGNFYDGLYQLKGVDMNVASLTFRYANTRGFSGENNYRLNQIIDGVENISPGLSFAAGNIFGIPELDVESVELIVGASSAIYGPGGMNGTLLMTSKNPFDYQGISFIAKGGVMNVGNSERDGVTPFSEFNLRWAKSFGDKVAVKINAAYLKATDWYAQDYRDANDVDNPNSTRESNEGYDGVNTYGDEIIVPVNLREIAPDIAAGICEENQGLTPGTPEFDACVAGIVSQFPDQVITRTGWKEKDLVDYNNTENIKISGEIDYRITEKLEAIANFNYSSGSSIYTAQNRFAVWDFDMYSGRIELRSPNFYLRGWGIKENSGRSYDAGTTALLMNEAWKPTDQWYEDYIGAFIQTILTGGSLESAYSFARATADNRDANGNVFNPGQPALPLPGTDEFNNYVNDIRSRPFNENGSMVVDLSSIWHMEGMYNFTHLIRAFELIVGLSNRGYTINSEGTVFFDEPGKPIHINQFGSFLQLAKSFMRDRMKVTASARYDKHQKFEGKFTPRVSLVYSIDRDQEHNVRASYQTAFRFPSTSDQWTDFDAGVYHTIGGLPEVQSAYGFDENPVYPLSGPNPITDDPVTENGPFIIPPFGPETVTALEVGYKGLYFNKRLFIDAYVYRNYYKGFLAQQLLAMYPNTPEEKRFQTHISTDESVVAFGWALSADYRFDRGFYVKGNVAYNTLEDEVITPGFQSAFNTPDYRFNISAGNREFTKNVGFAINYRWQNSFLWQSPFGTGEIPAFETIDAFVSYKLRKIKSIIKVGGSNILNNYYTTSFGSANVGGMYYISWTFDNYLN
jgi:outer membrane receptor protein involved in Fe transport